jgi:hypothetical protein
MGGIPAHPRTPSHTLAQPSITLLSLAEATHRPDHAHTLEEGPHDEALNSTHSQNFLQTPVALLSAASVWLTDYY